MKKILLCVLILLMVAAMVSALDLPNARPLKRAVQPYVEAWGPYSRCVIVVCEISGTSAGFAWWDAYGQVIHFVMFSYMDDEWILYDASGEIVETPANIG